MQDARVVRDLERVHDRIEDLCDALELDALASLFDRVEVVVQIHAHQELHHQTELAVVAPAHVEELDRCRALERAQRLLLPDQPLGHLRLLGGLRAQHLDRDRALHPAIVRAVHHALAAATDDVEHLVSLVDDVTDAIGGRSHGRNLPRRPERAPLSVLVGRWTAKG